MNKFQITATHMAFGTVVFIIEAEDDKQAFTKWKSVVFSGRQWVVKSNTKLTKQTFDEKPPLSSLVEKINGGVLEDENDL